MQTLRLREKLIVVMSVAALACCLSPLLLRVSARSQGKQGGGQSKGKEQKPQDADTVRIDTELVQIDVVVADKQGKLVRDLKREDFQILEDGKPQTISHFSVGTAGRQAAWLRRESSPAGAGRSNPVAAQPQQQFADGRYLVLAVDDVHLAPGNLMFAKRALTKFLDQQVGTNDQVALVTTTGALGMFQQFTGDREVMKRAVDRLAPRERRATSEHDTPRITSYQAELIGNGDPDALELAVQEIMRQFNIDRRMATSEAQSRARAIVEENTSVTVSTLSTLENVINGLRDLPGRKIIVLLSDGFLLGGLSDGRHYDVRRITDAATRAGVVIYSLDTRGLIASVPGMDASSRGFAETGALSGARFRIENSSIEAERDGMFALAKDTGGDAIFNNNDINAGLQKVLNDTETYYLLAFEPTTSYRDGRFRKIEVRLPSRPELKVRTRKGYFAPDDKAAEKEARAIAKAEEKDRQKTPEKLAKDQQNAATKQVREGIGSLYPLRGIPVEIAVNFINTPKEGSALDVVAHIDAAALKFTPAAGDRQHATLELVGMVFDESGKTAGTFGDKIEMNLRPASLENTLKNGVTYTKQLKLKPGYYQVRFVAREDGVKQIGSASSWIEIPDLEKKQLTLSSIFFPAVSGELTAALAQQKQSGGNGKAKEDAVVRYPAPIYRRFRRSGDFDFMVFAYNAKRNEKGATDLAVQTQIYAGDKLLLATPLRNIADGAKPIAQAGAAGNGLAGDDSPDPDRVPYLARLSLGAFDPGTYEMRVIVVDRNAKTSAKRITNFTVE